MALTITFDSTYANVTFSGPALDAFVADDTNTLNLLMVNSCGTEVTYAVDIDDVDTDGGNTYTRTAAQLGFSSTVTDGVYRFRLKYLGDTILTDTGYAYVAVQIPCQLIDSYAKYIDCIDDRPCKDNEHFWPAAFHELLKDWNGNPCSDWTYQNACTVWTSLNTMLETINDDDCGCD